MRIEGKGLRVVRGERLVLRDVDLSAAPHEVLGVLGPSGAGKSTLFAALVGELLPDAGQILLDGRDLTREPLWKRARAGIGYVPQTPSVLWDLTVKDNLGTYLALARATPSGGGDEKPWTVDALAARVELSARADVLASRLSGGERRRLELARALSMFPRVLICDEPFAGVDPKGAEHLGGLLAALAKEGVAVILADHHVEEALRICTRAVLLLDGEIRVEGDPESFVTHELVRGRYLGTITG